MLFIMLPLRAEFLSINYPGFKWLLRRRKEGGYSPAVFMTPITACLDAVYAPLFGSEQYPLPLERQTIDPRPTLRGPLRPTTVRGSWVAIWAAKAPRTRTVPFTEMEN